jgi:hypothetical protein
MKSFLLLGFLALPLYSAVFYLDPGLYTAGASQSVVSQMITVTLTGAPSSARRFLVAFPMSNTPNPVLYLPPGVTASCSGGTCASFPLNAPAGGSCDKNEANWPKDTRGRISVKRVACGDLNISGIISSLQNSYTDQSDQGAYNQIEGCQCVQGSEGPGPLTWRGNDTYMSGNEFHQADDVGKYAHKMEMWFYRNRIRPYWGAMFHPNNPERDGNRYGIRQQKYECKGGVQMTFEGNLFGGNFNSNSGSFTSSLLVLRNTNESASEILLTDNVFEHIAGFSLPGDSANGGGLWWGPTNLNFAAVNNVMWDINEKGPDTVGIGPEGPFNTPPGVTNSYADRSSGKAGNGWLQQGPSFHEGLVYLRNTIPDIRGRVPVLSMVSHVRGGGWIWKDNFLSVTKDNSAFGIGARTDQASVPECQGLDGYKLLVCSNPGNTSLSGNVILSREQTQAAIQADGWGTLNTVPAQPSNKVAIWPKYQVLDWHYDLDPEIYRLPVGSPYEGKGADITHLEDAMGYVRSPEALFDGSNNLIVSWYAPDNQVCTVDTAAPGQLYGTFTRDKSDSASSRYRRVVIAASQFTPKTSYEVRINCERMQPVLTARSN